MITDFAAVVLERKMGHYIPQGVQVLYLTRVCKNHSSHEHRWQQGVETCLTWGVSPEKWDKVTYCFQIRWQNHYKSFLPIFLQDNVQQT